MKLPAKYQWLNKEPAPPILVQARHLFGIVEVKGDGSNPLIMSWAKETGLTSMYSDDSVPWCGLFMAACAKRAGEPVPPLALRALNWANYGAPARFAMLGDVLTFKRDGGGHVGLYVGDDKDAYHVLGGNQSDQVCITRIAKTRLYAIRRSLYKERPPNVRVIKLEASGELSHNEA